MVELCWCFPSRARSSQPALSWESRNIPWAGALAIPVLSLSVLSWNYKQPSATSEFTLAFKRLASHVWWETSLIFRIKVRINSCFRQNAFPLGTCQFIFSGCGEKYVKWIKTTSQLQESGFSHCYPHPHRFFSSYIGKSTVDRNNFLGGCLLFITFAW